MSKIILVTTEQKEWEAYKVLNTSVNFSVIKQSNDKIQIRANTDDNVLVTIELNSKEYCSLLNEMKTLAVK